MGFVFQIFSPRIMHISSIGRSHSLGSGSGETIEWSQHASRRMHSCPRHGHYQPTWHCPQSTLNHAYTTAHRTLLVSVLSSRDGDFPCPSFPFLGSRGIHFQLWKLLTSLLEPSGFRSSPFTQIVLNPPDRTRISLIHTLVYCLYSVPLFSLLPTSTLWLSPLARTSIFSPLLKKALLAAREKVMVGWRSPRRPLQQRTLPLITPCIPLEKSWK